MKKQLVLLILVLISVSSIYSQKSGETKLLILSYNVENLMDTLDSPSSLDEQFTPMSYKNWNTKRYNKKIDDISKVISSIDTNHFPDLIGLQEVENKEVVKDIVDNKRLKGKKYKIVHEETSDIRGIDVALIYNPDVFTYTEHSQLQINLKNGKKYHTREILYVKGKIEGVSVHIFVNHWKSRNGGPEKTEPKRLLFASVLREKITEIQKDDPNANIICMGDFNDTPNDKSLNEILDASKDSIFDTNNELFNLAANLSNKNLGSYSYKGNWFMLDNIIVSQNLINKNNKIYAKEPAKIFKKKFVCYYNPKINHKIPSKTYGGNNYYGGISDHFAVFAYFYLKN